MDEQELQEALDQLWRALEIPAGVEAMDDSPRSRLHFAIGWAQGKSDTLRLQQGREGKWSGFIS